MSKLTKDLDQGIETKIHYRDPLGHALIGLEGEYVIDSLLDHM